MNALQSVAFFSVIISLAYSASVSQTGCVYNGITYPFGEEFRPSPCENCQCRGNGQAVCAISDCSFTPCVDAVQDPNECCPVCPNGPNCQHSDGTIIRMGDRYRPDDNTLCVCRPIPSRTGSTEAMCLVNALPARKLPLHLTEEDF